MSTETDNLKLFKYDTNNNTDMNTKFNLNTGLNNNWDKLDKAFGELNNDTEAYHNLTNDTKKRQDILEEKYNNQIKNIAGGEYQNAEIVEARNGFDTLRKCHKTENVSF